MDPSITGTSEFIVTTLPEISILLLFLIKIYIAHPLFIIPYSFCIDDDSISNFNIAMVKYLVHEKLSYSE